MSVAYEPRSFHEDSPYAPVGENDHDINKYINEANVADMANLAAATYEPANDSSPAVFDPSPSPALDLHPVGPPNVDPANVPVRDLSPAIQNAFNSTQNHSQRIKPIAKPNREVTKSEDGKFICTWPDCNELQKKFQRKCEWSKHMDKHERPYVCTAKGCEKIQGFTYSGGLLRHEREVHGKHGGPKKKLLCPHENCKRSSGKGFSRQENLSEHLRRVHTSAGPMQMDSPGDNNTDDSASDVASAAFAVMAGVAMSPANLDNHSADTGIKRKRSPDDLGRSHDPDDDRDDDDIRAEVKRLRKEAADLRQQLEEKTRSSSEMQAQLAAIQHALGNPINQTLGLQQAPEL
ncbi:c2h2 transcription factor [Diaporthe amygdali]|uniref:c2h2 transcription factor n=1 Tax=Phomopsis amygdali TaxID=1214568 RepID=UPI0022FEFC1F|nr:c2h2 transcription factor [Diaporthe amygdali]KAJ0107015.1 c2h2 transcription factor [Diaporthe amygdali]